MYGTQATIIIATNIVMPFKKSQPLTLKIVGNMEPLSCHSIGSQ